MAKLSYSERFTNVKKYDEAGSYIGLQIVSKLNQKNGQDYKLLDSIDIDWNGAWLAVANAYINNTEELLEAIDHLGELSDYEWVHNQINQINENIDTILATYVTQSQLDEILAQYQKPLQPGEHISIDSYNVISAYDILSEEVADSKYATITRVEDIADTLINNYYRKDDTQRIAHQIAIEEIQDKVIKNADERFNDLEKISNWINSLPSEIMDSAYLTERVNRLDDVVGYAIYNESEDSYSYTGLLETQRDYYAFAEATNEEMSRLRQSVTSANQQSYVAYVTSYTAYDLAYTAYIAASETDGLAMAAYEMAYESVITIGVPHSYSYFSYLTQEEIELLNQDSHAIQVYSIRPDNLSGIPLPDVYRPDSGLQYYTYTPEVNSTGFYKSLEEISAQAYIAQESADNALFRLYTRTNGTTYAKLELEPFINDGTNRRTMVLEIDEADIAEEDGLINKDGIITTYSLYNAFSYAFKPEFITNDD
ncbi:MAG: hypothetical protein IJH39_08330 [Clostridia bacterium]|nr:hypothetical protein [Clostridia bacterium]